MNIEIPDRGATATAGRYSVSATGEEGRIASGNSDNSVDSAILLTHRGNHDQELPDDRARALGRAWRSSYNPRLMEVYECAFKTKSHS